MGKSRSLGRKTNDKAMMNMPYGQISNNIRDSSVSNNSNPAGSSSLAAYTSAANPKKFSTNQGGGSQFNMINNFMGNLPQTFYNQVSLSNPKDAGSNYSYDINLNAVNKN